MPKLLEQEVAYCREHRAELAERHPEAFVVKSGRLPGAFATLRDAYAAAAAHAPKDPALIARLPTCAQRAGARESGAARPRGCSGDALDRWAERDGRQAVRHAIARVRREAAALRPAEQRAS